MFAQIHVGDTLQLGASGGKSYSWISSKKSVATVSSKGLVTAVAKGECNITVKDKKSKAKQVFKIKVTAAKLNKFNISNMEIWEGGLTIGYTGDNLEGCDAYLDGKKIDTDYWTEDGSYGVRFPEAVSEGSHTIVFKKAGYEDYTFKFEYKAPTYTGLIQYNPGIYDGWLYVKFNPDVKDDNSLVMKIDGETITLTKDNTFIDGGGLFGFCMDASSFSKGEHTITAQSATHPEETVKFVVE